MFAVAGIAFAKMLPKDKKLKILGIPNRLFFAMDINPIAGSNWLSWFLPWVL
jgi:hypothetical protein